MRYQLDAPMESAACGGTHRLFGLTWVYHLHLLHGGKTTGVWKDVADRLAEYKKKAQEQQNADGSFSTNYFRGKGNAPDAESRISTTGHILEWLSLASTDDELRQPWMRDAANALAMTILDSQGAPREGGIAVPRRSRSAHLSRPRLRRRRPRAECARMSRCCRIRRTTFPCRCPCRAINKAAGQRRFAEAFSPKTLLRSVANAATAC